MVRSQIGNLTPGPFFGHNLRFKCPNESCKPTLDIKVPRAFQRYKELFNEFWPLQLPSEDLGIHRDSNSQSGSSFGSARVHFLTHSYTHGSMKCDSWASVLVRTFASPCFGHECKAKVATHAMVNKPWKQGHMSIIYNMSLKVEKYMYYIFRLHQYNRILFTLFRWWG